MVSTLSLASSVGAPTAAVLPPGQCVFKADVWTPAPLIERMQETDDTFLLTFGLADDDRPLGLSTCACLLAMFKDEGTGEPIIRPYTPVSTNALKGKFQMLIKVYPGGKMSGHMDKMPIGATLDFKHIEKNVKVQYPFDAKHITMLSGGTGVAPMIQALHAILGTEGDETKVVLLLGNKTQKDTLAKGLLDAWESKFPDRFKVVHVLSAAADDDTWVGAKGFIDQTLVKEHCAPPSEDTKVFVCGPPPMYDALCGPRDKPEELTGALEGMGYAVEQVVKF